MAKNPAAKQLEDYKATNRSGTLTSSNGDPSTSATASMSVGERGPLLLQDFHLIDNIAHFDRERIPERVVHAKGAGAFGYFQVTHDVTKYTTLSAFQGIGKKTPVAVRFSTVAGQSGSPDPERDPRGFAVRFYTEDGNWDIVGNNTPIFFIRDAMLFPHFVHSQKRNPTTHLRDPNMFWDFISLRPESTHQTLFVFSDRGIPDGYRHMNGYGSHTFKLVNARGEHCYCKFHFKTDQGIKNLPADKALGLCATDPDYFIKDLYNAIANKEYPSWTLCLQIMTHEEAEKYKWNPFDVTKVWPHGDFPLFPVGKMVLDQNPKNYFTDVEQIGFSPAHMNPGVEPSPDKMLQGRLFAYSDTQRHRLGANYLQIPVNCPYRSRVTNYQRDGPMNITENMNGAPNYYPNSFSGPEPTRFPQSKCSLKGDVVRHDSGDEDNFSQATIFWNKTLNSQERKRLVANMVGHMKDAADFIQERAVKNFYQVSRELGDMLTEGLQREARTGRSHL